MTASLFISPLLLCIKIMLSSSYRAQHIGVETFHDDEDDFCVHLFCVIIIYHARAIINEYDDLSVIGIIYQRFYHEWP